MRIYVDTSALLPLLDADDAEHGAAATALTGMRDAELVTTNYVVVETTSLLQRRIGAAAVRDFLDDLLPVLEVVFVDRELHAVATASFVAGLRRRASIVDHAGFALMRRDQIEVAFAFDRDFARAGFAVVPN